MNPSMRTIRNFIVTNLFAFVPLLWAALGWMPDQVKIQWRGNPPPSPATILADGMVLQGELYGAWSEGTVWRFYLREGMTWKELAFRLPPGTGSGAIGRIDLQKWKLFCLGKTGTNLVPTEGVENGWHFANPRFESIGFASRSGAFGLFALEVLLLGLSWLFAKYHREEKWKTLWAPVCLVALALAALMQVALPIQSYLANQSAYPFTFGALAGALAVRFAWTFAICAVAIGLLGRCFGRWVLGAVLAFAVCVYLESGILSAGLPDLNGDWWFFQNRTRAMWDAAVWAGVFVSFALLHPLLKRHYGLVSTCLMVMTAASMFDVNHEEKADTSKLLVHDFVPVETVIRSVTYSTNRNVLVFVLDSLEREQAHAIMEDPGAGPGLREKFRGFVEYADNVGVGNRSELAVANLFTGKYVESATGLANYHVSLFEQESVLADYLANGASVYLGSEALGYGYTNRKGEEGKGQTDEAWTLQEISRLRWIPFCAKFRCGRIMELSKRRSSGIWLERVVYPILAKRAEAIDAETTFLFVHTGGVHFPVQWNRYGEELPVPNDTFGGIVEAGIYVLGLLGDLFDVYREHGIYDNSLILVMADHGNHGHGPDSPGGLPGIAKPFLWIKPAMSQHDFQTSTIPTSHSRVSALLEKALENTFGDDGIRKVLSCPNRLYRELHGSSRHDWWVDSDGHVTTEVTEMEKAAHGIRPLEEGHMYSFDLKGPHADELADIALVDFSLRFWPRWAPNTPQVKIQFKVPDPKRTWQVRLEVLPWMWGPYETQENRPDACFKFWVEGQEKNAVEVLAGTSASILLKGVTADPAGWISIVGEHDDGIRSICRLTTLQLNSSK